ncbi:PQQ-dependent sugar dehydrogenase [Leucobacter sp. CSA1]|uniref:PQQ-dependent sugar dehydrogenase n=1 Tax=Leucobacter chromiisoli TaxID=2796471 RepID=A0A934UWX1_9MICO|nr:PQQ-dependent sugar dehydrogenase [Leucobacter chromiisoli]
MTATRSPLATLFATAALLTVVGCTSIEPGEPESRPGISAPPPSTTAPDGGYTGPALAGLSSEDFEVEVLSDELQYPWEVQLAGDAFIVTEIAGTIAMIGDGGLERYELQTSDPVVHDGGSGLLGIELTDDFDQSGVAYVYYSYADGEDLANRVAEVVFDGETWAETSSLVDGIPGHQLYNGGRISFGPDGHLYVTTGWTPRASRSRGTSETTPSCTRSGTATRRAWAGAPRANCSWPSTGRTRTTRST